MDSITYRTNAARTVRIAGEASCGKTACLINRVDELLESGVAPDDIAVVCASPNAARAFKQRLVACAGAKAQAIPVKAARSHALDVLATPEAVAFTGREARVLSQFEVSFLMEDMKTSGLRPRRLKEMLKFFYRTWSELGDWKEGWLLAGEETTVHTLLKDSLGMVRGILEPELANLAVRFLLSEAADRSALSIPHVFVDDYQALSGASQILAGTLASETLTVAGNPNETTDAFDSYPYAEGFARFAEDNAGCELVELNAYHHSEAVHAAVAGFLAEHAGENAPRLVPAETVESGTLAFREFARPEDEIEGVSVLVREQLDAGLKPEDILVVAPNRTWARLAAQRLDADGVAAQDITSSQPLSGDVRDRDRCGGAFLYTALRLVANPDDAVSLRAWCGFGDYLAHSNSFLKLRALMDDKGMTLPEALEYASDLSTIGADLAKIVPAYEYARELAAKLADLRGMELIDRLADLVEATEKEKAAVAALCTPCDEDDAATLAARIERTLLEPVFAEGAVRVCSPELACGLTPTFLVFCGFVNGFVPCRAYFDGAEMPLDKQERERERLVVQLYTTFSKAQRDLAVTYFTKTDLETAERAKIKVKRIRLEQGVRTALTERSVFADVMEP